VSRLLPLVVLAALAAGCPTSVRYADCQAGTVDLRSDPAHCGGCHRACPQGVPCEDGTCVVPEGVTVCRAVAPAEPDMPFPSGDPTNVACGDGDETYADRRSVVVCTVADLPSDPRNCGQCGRICPEASDCVGGRCACEAGRTLCETNEPDPWGPAPADLDERWWSAYHSIEPIERTCVDVQDDRENCGECRLVCPETWNCRDGTCVEPPAPEPDEPAAPPIDPETGLPCCPPE